MGPDGHTASLFPNHLLLDECDHQNWIQYLEDSPKPPSKRITLSLNVINSAGETLIVATGDQKAKVIRQVI